MLDTYDKRDGFTEVHSSGDSCVFHISNGLANNSQFKVQQNVQYIVGYNIECDIIIRDQSIGDSIVEIMPTSQQVTVECLSGTVEYKGQHYSDGDIIFVEYMSTFSIGGISCFVSEPTGLTASPRNQQHNSDFQEILNAHEQQLKYTPATKSKSKLNLIFGALSLVALMLALVFFWPKSNSPVSPSGILSAHSGSAQSLSAQSSISENMYATSPTGSASIADRITSVSPQDMLAQEQYVLSDIKAILTHMGYDANAQFTAPGQVRIRSNISSMEELRTIERIITQDIPGIVSISIESDALQSPRNGVADNKLREFSALVERISDSGLPYLVTTDGSWYFVGSVLPTGHELINISDDVVTVSLNNQDSEVHF